jgi:hypothetical protein
LRSLQARAQHEAWVRSNPVASLQARLRREGSTGTAAERQAARRLLSAGYELSAHYLENLGLAPDPAAAGDGDSAQGRRHGVVGLVLGGDVNGAPFAWADRLRAEPAQRWEGRAGLPFEPLDLLGVLLRLLRARPGDELLQHLPEAKAFAIIDEIDEQITGPSMTVAGALAVLDAATGHARPELAAVASFVQLPPGLSPDGAAGQELPLVRVEGEAAKLAGFQRECGRGSLCLVAPDTTLDERELHRSFEAVWRVEDLDRLGGRLEAAGLLADLARPAPLSLRELGRVEDLLGRLRKRDFLVRRARDLAVRLEAVVHEVGLGRDVPASRARRALGHAAQPLRFDAVLGEAVAAARGVLERAEAAPDLASHGELCAAAIELAAAYYVQYDFAAMAAVMLPWRERLRVDPHLVDAKLRVRVLGNLGRAQAMGAGADEPEAWRATYAEALTLQALNDPSGLPLTRGFQVGALLAWGYLDEAEVALEQAESELMRRDYPGNLSLWFLRFDRADLARRRGEVWQDPEMERDGVVQPGQFGRAMGYYFQATARQVGRAAPDAAERFERAASFFAAGTPPVNSGQWAFVHLCRLGAAERRRDRVAWRAARADLAAFLATDEAAGIRAWYGRLAEDLPLDFQAELDFEAGGAAQEPAAALEALFARDPYFLGRGPA